MAGQRGGFSNMHRLFALLMIELWRREYRISTVEPVTCSHGGAGGVRCQVAAWSDFDEALPRHSIA